MGWILMAAEVFLNVFAGGFTTVKVIVECPDPKVVCLAFFEG